MSALDAGRNTQGIRGFRPRRILMFAARSLAVALLLATGYVANYWALHWLMYRGWMSAGGPDRVLSRVYRTPGDWYAASALPGARVFDHWKREWQRSGRHSYEQAWYAQRLQQRSIDAGTTPVRGTLPMRESHAASGH